MQMDYYTLVVECPINKCAPTEAILLLNFISGWSDENISTGKRFTFFLPYDKTGEERLKAIKEQLKSENLSLTETILKGEAWEETWKKNFKTRKIEEIVVTPPWEPYTPKGKEQVIVIEPGMAFGTGDHATTALCIKLLQKFTKQGNKVLDLGTGSGILAMTASLLGSGETLGIDNDSIAVAEAIENTKKMKLEDKVQIELRDAHESIAGEYDIICANLFMHQIDNILKSKVPFLKKGGIFIGSGITAEQSEFAQKSIDENGFESLEFLTENNWIAFAARKR